MTEQNKDRQFAVGDIVISKEFGIGHVLNVTKHGYVDALFGSTRLTFDMQGKYEKDKPPDIKTIRNPRKGGKEARDIVARLARDYRNEVINYHNEHFKSLRVCYIRLRSDREWKVYDREKSMLGASMN